MTLWHHLYLTSIPSIRCSVTDWRPRWARGPETSLLLAFPSPSGGKLEELQCLSVSLLSLQNRGWIKTKLCLISLLILIFYSSFLNRTQGCECRGINLRVSTIFIHVLVSFIERHIHQSNRLSRLEGKNALYWLKLVVEPSQKQTSRLHII